LPLQLRYLRQKKERGKKSILDTFFLRTLPREGGEGEGATSSSKRAARLNGKRGGGEKFIFFLPEKKKGKKPSSPYKEVCQKEGASPAAPPEQEGDNTCKKG